MYYSRHNIQYSLSSCIILLEVSGPIFGRRSFSISAFRSSGSSPLPRRHLSPDAISLRDRPLFGFFRVARLACRLCMATSPRSTSGVGPRGSPIPAPLLHEGLRSSPYKTIRSILPEIPSKGGPGRNRCFCVDVDCQLRILRQKLDEFAMICAASFPFVSLLCSTNDQSHHLFSGRSMAPLFSQPFAVNLKPFSTF